MKKEKIGFFDSGFGGTTVLKEVLKKYSNLDFVYFGDSLNAPYGQKSQEEIIKLTEEAFKFLKEKGCNKIITACNSVSAIINFELAERVGVERENILEMSLPTINYCLKNNIKDILVLSTKATKESGLYSKQFSKKGLEVASLAINGLVDLIETTFDRKEMVKVIERELKKDKVIFKKIQEGKYQNIILACTHFPLIEEIFQTVFLKISLKNKKLNFINPAIFVADEFEKKFLKDLRKGKEWSDRNKKKNEQKFYFSKKIKNNFLKDYLG